MKYHLCTYLKRKLDYPMEEIILEVIVKKKWDKYGKYYLMKCKKLRLNFRSTNRDGKESQKDFKELVDQYLEYLFYKGELKETLKALGFEYDREIGHIGYYK